MRILLSAYACEPGKGSEPGAGWNWALELAALDHDVWVLTRTNNRDRIENASAEHGRLRFAYYDLPTLLQRFKKSRPGFYLYYYLWQFGATRLARRLHHEHRFEHVLHITIGTFRIPSFMGALGIPFTFGPLGGGETAPSQLRSGYGLRGRLLDGLRDMLNGWVRYDPVLNHAYGRAQHILVKTSDTGRWIHSRHRSKIREQIEIGTDGRTIATGPVVTRRDAEGLRVLFVGRFLYWKGIHLGLRAFAAYESDHAGASLTLVGAGPDETRLRSQAEATGSGNAVTWMPWVDQAQLPDIYASHDLLLFTSLHDSSGNAVLEAMTYGLPVVCLDLGGPARLVDDTCGRVIPVRDHTETQVVDDIARVMHELGSDAQLRGRLADGALDAARARTWSATVRSAVTIIEQGAGTSGD